MILDFKTAEQEAKKRESEKQRVSFVATEAHHLACILYGVAAQTSGNEQQWNNALQAVTDLAMYAKELKEVL